MKCLGLGFRVLELRFRILGLRFRVLGLKLGLELRQELGFDVKG